METPTLWVSAENGDDANDGSTQALAKATVDAAASIAVAGDIVNIFPGTYREVVTAAAAGTSGNPIIYQGDSKCQYDGIGNEYPGRVRITDTNASEEPQSAAQTISSPQDYVEWHNIWTDGSLRGIDFGAIGNGRIVQQSVMTGSTMGVENGLAIRTIAISGGSGFYFGETVNCTGVGGLACFRNSLDYNSTAIGGYNGFFYNNVATGGAYNCTAFGCCYGFTNPAAAAQVNNCHSLFCRGAGNTIMAGETVNCYYYGCLAEYDADFGSPGLTTLPDFSVLKELLPWVAVDAAGGILRQGSNVVPNFGATDVDIGGDRLRLKGTGIDIWPASVSEPTDTPYAAASPGMVDWGTLTPNGYPSLKITTEGDIAIGTVRAEGDKTVSVSCQAKYDTITGSKPQLILRGDTITEQTANMTNGDDTWEKLSVSAIPDSANELLTIILRARNTAGDCYFGEVVVSGGGDSKLILVRDLGGFSNILRVPQGILLPDAGVQ